MAIAHGRRSADTATTGTANDANRDHAARYIGGARAGQESLNFVHEVAEPVARIQDSMMRPIRQTARWLRLAVAALFAVSAVTQIPAMSVAHAMKPIQPIEATIAHHHHHHSDHSRHSDLSGTIADVAHDGSLCFAMGCCLALAAIGLGAPAASSVLLGVMAITSVPAMLPVSLDPADPPPRLQV
jgi:hypothetical protein